MTKYILVFTVAFVASLVLTPLAKELSYRFGILDQPGKRKIHAEPIPLMGGIGVLIAFLLALLFSSIETKTLFAISLVGMLFVAFGLLDDAGKKVHAKYKIAAHLFFSFLFIYLTGIYFNLFVWWWLNWIVSACFITFMTNSMNMLDGMDGLVPGISFLSSFFFLIIAIKLGQASLAFACLAVMGAVLGFLKYNFNPASIFLGEAGSTLLGALMAGLVISFSKLPLLFLSSGFWKSYDDWTSLLIGLIILGIPIFDTYFVFINRFWNRIKFNTPGKDHLHHRLHLMGLSQRDTVLVLYGIQIVLGAVALILFNANLLQFISLLVILLMLVVFTWFFLTRVKVYGSSSLKEGPL